MKIRFQADNDLDRAIVHGVVRRVPAVNFRFDPLDAVDDVSVLRIAASEGRILVSHDFRTMPTAFAEYRREAHSPGVLLAPQLWPLGDIIERLVLVWELSEAEEWQNRICYLPTLADLR